MKRLYLQLLFLIWPGYLFPQYKLTFNVVQESPGKYDTIFVAGSFNNWDRSNQSFRLVPAGPHHSITINLPNGTYQYAFSHAPEPFFIDAVTIGKDTVRSIELKKDTIVSIRVKQWYDDTAYFKQLLRGNIQDSVKIWILNKLGRIYTEFAQTYNRDSALWCGHQVQLLLQKMKSAQRDSQTQSENSTWLNDVRYQTAEILTAAGNFSEALQLRLECLHDMEQAGDNDYAYWQMCDISNQYLYMKDYELALKYSYKIRDIFHSGYTFKSERWKNFFSGRMAERFYLNGLTLSFIGLKRWDSALLYARQYYEVARSENEAHPLTMSTVSLAKIYSHLGQDDTALYYYKSCVPFANLTGLLNLIADSELGIAKLFQRKGEYDSALSYARKSWNTYQEHRKGIQLSNPGSSFDFIEAGEVLSDLYRVNKKYDSAYKYLQLVTSIKDSVYNQENLRRGQNVTFNETLRQQKLEQKRIDTENAYKAKIKLYVFIGGLGVMAAIIFSLYRNNRQKNKTNRLLNSKNEEIQTTLSELKSTQSQLIQSEKMASLGELTAGIAHEIQNPLNFVNNFSEVNEELLKEMKDEMTNGKIDDALALANDAIENQKKINHHGKRADAIVKGMLQHSRSSSGVKEPTDINVLADEYLRLAYHGLRAKDKSFNATLKTDFDESIGNINIIPQDIGRVILNLITNAFYAVTERKKQVGDGYEPTVSVSTKKINGKAEVRVKDNGNGIPQEALDKIFQPFFTTKPTGQGTGLGLSLAYDIVKAHGGELKVETKEGEGAEFMIQLLMV